MTISHLEPTIVWKHFEKLTQIPRPSRHEEQVVAHVKAWAAERGFKVLSDKVGNIVVQVPASPGKEKAKTVILQGHLDLVAEKDKATEHDFLKDPVDVVIKGEWVVAEKTTLGADNGIGVAAAMAVADDKSAVHGPLELLFTIDEETALTGASALDGKMLQGRTLLNLDSEDEHTLFVGCAGGCTSVYAAPLARAAAPAGHVALRLEVGGLRGGHSGLNIHENRGNSLKVAARVLRRWAQKVDVRLESIEGGSKHNAIPREAQAVAYVPAGFVAEAKALAADAARAVLEESAAVDPGLTINVAETSAGEPMDAASTGRALRLLVGLPHGVLVMSRDIVGTPETSTNVAIAATEKARLTVTTSTRSSIAPALRAGLEQGAAVAEICGATVEEQAAYPGWKPDMSSELLGVCKTVYRELRGKDPIVTAIHAGLECGIIGERVGGKVDMISFGPILEGVHAPGEKLHIASVGRFYDFLKAVLARLA